MGVGNNGLVVDDEGGIYVAGEHNPAGSPMTFGGLLVPTNGNDDVFLAKLNENGIWQWAKDLYCAPWAGTFPGMFFRDLELGTAGDILVGGRYTGYHAVFDNDTILTNQHYPCGEGMTFYLASYRTDGTFDWARTAEADMAGLSDMRSILPIQDGEILGLIQYGDTLHLGSSVMIHPWAACLAHFAADGTVISADPLQDHEPSEIIDALRYGNGMTYTVASLANTPLAIAGTTYTSAGGTDLLLSAIDGLNGAAGLHLGGGGNESRGKIRATADGIVLGGSFEQTFSVGNDVLTSSGAGDMFITRISTGPLGVNDQGTGGPALVIAPNPTTGLVSLALPPALLKERIELLDGTGRLLGTFAQGRSLVDLDLSTLAPGPYLLRCGRVVVPFLKQ